MSLRGFPGGAVLKDLLAKAGDTGDEGLVPRLGRSPGVGNGNLPHFFAWKILRTVMPGGLPSLGSQRVRHDGVTENAHAHARTHTHTHHCP